MLEEFIEVLKSIPLFWIGFIAGIITCKLLRYLYDIYRGIRLYFEMKNWDYE